VAAIRKALTVENRLAELRAQHQLSQAALAELLGVSRQTVISIERGRFDPSLPLAFTIARHFGTPRGEGHGTRGSARHPPVARVEHDPRPVRHPDTGGPCMSTDPTVIVAGARTPMGRMSGSLKGFSGSDLGGFAIKGALEKAGSTRRTSTT
jgi:DNA-binding XRE family transcriptional regulator